MRLLLDTHALIWWTRNSPSLGRAAQAAIEDSDNEVWVSAISALEIATKNRLGKLPNSDLLAYHFEREIQAENFRAIPVTPTHAQLAGNLQISNKDPFDRVLIAQSLLEHLTLVSNERSFDSTGVARIW